MSKEWKILFLSVIILVAGLSLVTRTGLLAASGSATVGEAEYTIFCDTNEGTFTKQFPSSTGILANTGSVTAWINTANATVDSTAVTENRANTVEIPAGCTFRIRRTVLAFRYETATSNTKLTWFPD